MIVKFIGPEATSTELQEGLIALSNFARGLRGGNTPFVLELTKDDTGTKLVVQTFRDVDPSSTEQPVEPTPVASRARVPRSRREKKNEEVISEPVSESAVDPVQDPPADAGLLPSE